MTARESLRPGDWTPTGWGAQHRVRCSDEKWTELVCHNSPWPSSTVQRNDRVETSRIQRDADESERCPRCAALPDLGPLVRPPRGEVRRSSDGVVAFAKYSVNGDDRLDRAAGKGWHLIGHHPELGDGNGWCGDWDVAGWEAVGNLHDVTEPCEPPGPALVGGMLPLGEVRRRADGLTAVCFSDRLLTDPQWRETREYPEIRWALLGPEPEPGCYGWRTDGECGTWARVGNVFELGAAQSTPTVSDEPGPAGQVELFSIPEVA